MRLTSFFGSLLLILGLAIIAYAIFYSYQIFTNKVSVPVIFEPSPVKINADPSVFNLEAQFEKIIGSQFQQMLPVNSIPKIFNLFSWSIFAGILILAGSQVAGLGVKLLKN